MPSIGESGAILGSMMARDSMVILERLLLFLNRNENMVRRGCPDHTLSVERWKRDLRARAEKGYYY